MLLIKAVQKHYYNLISGNLKVPLYNHLPESATFPLIKLSRIATDSWVLTPESKVLRISFEIYSNASSNIECLEILENLQELIFSAHNLVSDYHISQQIFEHGEIYQIDNDIWCASFTIKVYVVTKH
ncbi:MAG: hypothetical protein ACHP6I_01540 [Rickettsiales bacterium]